MPKTVTYRKKDQLRTRQKDLADSRVTKTRTMGDRSKKKKSVYKRGGVSGSANSLGAAHTDANGDGSLDKITKTRRAQSFERNDDNMVVNRGYRGQPFATGSVAAVQALRDTAPASTTISDITGKFTISANDTITLSTYFTDADGDAFTYSVSSSITGVVAVSESGGTLTLNYGDTAGTATVTVIGTANGVPTTQTFDVTTTVQLLLDSYGSAAVGHSLRLLTTSYSGKCVKVRRASDDVEVDVDFYSGAISLSSVITVTSGSYSGTMTLGEFTDGVDAFVIEWYDQSGNTNDATQPTAAYQPKIVSSGALVTENGKPAMEFDGSNDALQQDTFTMGNDDVHDAESLSIMAVVTLDNVPAATGLNMHLFGAGLSIASSSGNTYGEKYGDKIIVYHDGGAANFRRVSADNASGVNLEGAVAVADTQYLVAYTWANGGTRNFSINGGTAATSTTARNAYVSSLKASIGGGIGNSDISVSVGVDVWDGTIQEVVQWRSDQESNRTNMVSGINSFYEAF